MGRRYPWVRRSLCNKRAGSDHQLPRIAIRTRKILLRVRLRDGPCARIEIEPQLAAQRNISEQARRRRVLALLDIADRLLARADTLQEIRRMLAVAATAGFHFRSLER